ncbi:MAG: hypothetical protein ACYDAC_06520 [Candidatus Dormibacteria bacterium]
MDDENDRWIETELSRSFDRLDLRPTPAQGRYRSTTPHWRRRRMSLLTGLPAVLTTKAAATAAIVLTAAGGAVATKAAVTGDPNPVNWGSTVTQAVQSCKAALTSGEHGIGHCVSNTADQHGQNQSKSGVEGGPDHTAGATESPGPSRDHPESAHAAEASSAAETPHATEASSAPETPHATEASSAPETPHASGAPDTSASPNSHS